MKGSRAFHDIMQKTAPMDGFLLKMVRVERLELPTSCSQTVKLNFLWLLLMAFNHFRYIPLTL